MSIRKTKSFPFEFNLKDIRNIGSEKIIDEIEKRGLTSLRALHQTATPASNDEKFVARAEKWSDTDIPFLVDQLADSIPFLVKADVERKIISLRSAVCIARDQSRVAIGNLRSLNESRLQILKAIEEIRLLQKSGSFDDLRCSYFALKIDMHATEIDRCRHFLSQSDPSQRFSVLNLEHALSEPNSRRLLFREIEIKLSKLAGSNIHLQKRVFISYLVGWWKRNTGKMPAKNRKERSYRRQNVKQVDFYQFLECARQDAGLTNVPPAPNDQTGPFERLVRDVITDLQKQ